MKKVVLFIALVLGSFAVSAQDRVYEPYFNVGASIGSNVTGITTEIGTANVNSRYALSASKALDRSNGVAIGPKAYFKIAGRDAVQPVNFFATGAVTMDLDRYHAITFEPGVAALFNFHGLTPQATLAFPIRENEVLRGRALGVKAGLALNF